MLVANSQRWLTARDDSGYMPMHIASQFDSLEMFYNTVLDNLSIQDFGFEMQFSLNERDKDEIKMMKQCTNCTTKEG